MAVLKIVRMGHPVLLRRADPVPLPLDAETRRLVRDMIETMEDASGAGLAAPQVAVPLRLIVFRVPVEPAGGAPGDVALHTRVLLNPELTPCDPTQELGWEGCLSIPGLRGGVPRWTSIVYRGTDPEGRAIETEAQGFHARVVQHEVDHLDGILYPMRMTDFRLFGFNEELARLEPADAAAGAGQKETA